MEDNGRILTDPPIVSIKVSLSIQQEVGDIDRDHQKQLTLTSVNRAVGTAKQQHQGWQHIEQRCEENTQVPHIGRRQSAEQKEQ